MLYESSPAETRLTVYRGAPVEKVDKYVISQNLWTQNLKFPPTNSLRQLSPPLQNISDLLKVVACLAMRSVQREAQIKIGKMIK